MCAAYQKSGADSNAQPLKDASSKVFLDGAFEEIEVRWGSVGTYLERRVGVTKADLELFRASHLAQAKPAKTAALRSFPIWRVIAVGAANIKERFPPWRDEFALD